MVFDTLYGLDDMGQSRPQMCAGHDVSADGLTWTFTLRDGLTFHDGERVLAKDCAMSVRRWGSRDLFGQPLLAATNDIETIDGVTRRTSREPVSQGGWSCFITQIEGVAACTPGGSFELRGNGAKAWFGWPDDEELERLRTAWFTRQTFRRRRRSPSRFSCVRWKPCRAFRLGNCSSRRRSDPTSRTS